jgi:hypothetical protein
VREEDSTSAEVVASALIACRVEQSKLQGCERASRGPSDQLRAALHPHDVTVEMLKGVFRSYVTAYVTHTSSCRDL